MAALGKIRSKGITLIVIIGLGLFAFIAEEAFRSCNGIKGEARQQVGEVLGEKINVQDFQKLVDEYQDAIKFTMQRDNLSETELNQVKDQVWQQMITNRVIEADAQKVGITVTEKELQNVLNEGTDPMLSQTPFINQQTGRFDVTLLKQFLDGYEKAKTSNPQQAEQMKTAYNYWMFVEKNLRAQLLGQKFQVLYASCVLSNKAEAKLAFKDENEEAQIQLASMAYTSVKDADVKYTDEDLKTKYEELKPMFRHLVVSKSNSLIPYIGLPVSSSAYQAYPDIASKIDSLGIGTTNVTENKEDNTLNIIRVLNKEQLPDSVQFRQIQVAAATKEQSMAKADSIQKALNGGADFDAIAKRYGQTGEKIWLTGQQYEHATTMNEDNRQFINAIMNGTVNGIQNLVLSQGNVILQVLDKKAMKTKITAAIIKKTIDFSKDTRNTVFNKFSEYVAKGTTLADLEKNAAKYGYKVQENKNITTAEHYLAGVHGTREALKWLFEAKEGDVSPLYECGDNDHFMVVVLTKIHPQGYRPWNDAEVKDILKREVIKDKKAEMFIAKLKGIGSIAAAKAKGAKISEINQITFASPVFVQATGAAEPALSGAVAATAAGKFSKNPVKGNAGVYVFQVVNKAMRAGVKYDEAKQMQMCMQQNMQAASGFMQDLVLNAKVVDNRYLFF